MNMGEEEGIGGLRTLMAFGAGLLSPHALGREEPGGPGASEAGLVVTQLPSPSLLPTLGSQPRPDPSALRADVNSWVPATWGPLGGHAGDPAFQKLWPGQG